jgi:hypothetical protein
MATIDCGLACTFHCLALLVAISKCREILNSELVGSRVLHCEDLRCIPFFSGLIEEVVGVPLGVHVHMHRMLSARIGSHDSA